MGFFFSDTKKPKNKIDRIAESFSCKACPRNTLSIDSPKMEPSGSIRPIHYIVGESPGREEDEDGIQFIGSSGGLISDVLTFLGESERPKNIRYNNVVRCYNNNVKPSPFEINCCKSSLFKDIEKTKPLNIWGFGPIPLKTFLGGKKITLWRGRRIPIAVGSHKCFYYPMFHPSFVLNNRKPNFVSEIEKVFIDDIRNVYESEDFTPEVITDGYEDGIKILTSTLDIKDVLDYYSYRDYVALDIETNGLNPYPSDSKLLTIAISDGDLIVSFELNDAVKPLLYKFFMQKNVHKIAHNLKFELEWFYHWFGTQDFMRKSPWEDTMLQAYLIDERTSKEEGMLSLDTLCLLNFGFNLKEKSIADRKDLTKFSFEEIALYNGMDAKYTYKLFMKQNKLIEKTPLDFTYKRLIDSTITLVLTQNYGLLTDNHKVDELSSKYEKELLFLKEQIESFDEVISFNRNKKFNILSPNDTVTLLKDVYKLPELKVTTKGKKYAVDEEVLSHWADEGYKLIELILSYRKLNKLKSTYVDALKDLTIDNILHANYNLAYTSTGRLSSGRE